MESAVWGLIGTIVGAIASIATTWLSISSSSKLQEERVRAERRERANAFQRETLLELQEAVHGTLRLVHQAYIEDRDSLRAGTPWSKAMLSDKLDENLRLARHRIAILVERVSDDNVRQQVKALMKIASQATLATSEPEAKAHLDCCSSESYQVLETLGSALRSYY